MAGGDLSKSSCPSRFGDRALWPPHEVLALGLTPHIQKTELGKMGNVHGWAGETPEASEQVMPAGSNIAGQSPPAPCSFRHIVRALHGMVLIMFINQIHFTPKHFCIYSLIWSLPPSCNIIKQ